MASRRYFDASKPLSDVSGSPIPDDLDRSIAFEGSGIDEKGILDGLGESCSQQTTP